ncbi:hypothetical protein V6N12_035864 [Hibiscus sabdariffa]|uniref:Uncharacterized protein n=1 Tax=Hibiscus sabdariffa TaxID=183260 RepID=A0ABR2ENY6_9ROSI
MSQPPSSTSPFRYEHKPTSRTSSSAIMCSETGPEPLSAPFVLIAPPPPPSPSLSSETQGWIAEIVPRYQRDDRYYALIAAGRGRYGLDTSFR